MTVLTGVYRKKNVFFSLPRVLLYMSNTGCKQSFRRCNETTSTAQSRRHRQNLKIWINHGGVSQFSYEIFVSKCQKTSLFLKNAVILFKRALWEHSIFVFFSKKIVEGLWEKFWICCKKYCKRSKEYIDFSRLVFGKNLYVQREYYFFCHFFVSQCQKTLCG